MIHLPTFVGHSVFPFYILPFLRWKNFIHITTTHKYIYRYIVHCNPRLQATATACHSINTILFHRPGNWLISIIGQISFKFRPHLTPPVWHPLISLRPFSSSWPITTHFVLHTSLFHSGRRISLSSFLTDSHFSHTFWPNLTFIHSVVAFIDPHLTRPHSFDIHFGDSLHFSFDRYSIHSTFYISLIGNFPFPFGYSFTGMTSGHCSFPLTIPTLAIDLPEMSSDSFWLRGWFIQIWKFTFDHTFISHISTHLHCYIQPTISFICAFRRICIQYIHICRYLISFSFHCWPGRNSFKY